MKVPCRTGISVKDRQWYTILVLYEVYVSLSVFFNLISDQLVFYFYSMLSFGVFPSPCIYVLLVEKLAIPSNHLFFITTWLVISFLKSFWGQMSIYKQNKINVLVKNKKYSERNLSLIITYITPSFHPIFNKFAHLDVCLIILLT